MSKPNSRCDRHGVDLDYVGADKRAAFDAKLGLGRERAGGENRLRSRAENGCRAGGGSSLSGSTGDRCWGGFGDGAVRSGTAKSTTAAESAATTASNNSTADSDCARHIFFTVQGGLVSEDKIAGENDGLVAGKIGAGDAEGAGLSGGECAVGVENFSGGRQVAGIDGAVGVNHAQLVARLFRAKRTEHGRSAELGRGTITTVRVDRRIEPGKFLHGSSGSRLVCRSSTETGNAGLTRGQFFLIEGERHGGGDGGWRCDIRGGRSDGSFVHRDVVGQSHGVADGFGFPHGALGKRLRGCNSGCDFDRGRRLAPRQFVRFDDGGPAVLVGQAFVLRKQARVGGESGGSGLESREENSGGKNQHRNRGKIQGQPQGRTPEQAGDADRFATRAILEARNLVLQQLARDGVQIERRAGVLTAAFDPGAERFFNVAFFRHDVTLVGRSFGRFRPGKNGPRDGFEPVEAFAEAGADGFRVEDQGFADFLVAKVAEVTEFDDFAAGFAELFERLVEEGHALGIHEGKIRRGGVGGRIDDGAVSVIDGMQGNGDVAAAAFGGGAALAVIARLVGGDAEDPGLKLAAAVEGGQVFDDGKKDFLGDFLDVFTGKIVRQLEDEPSGGGIMAVEQFIPGVRFACAAAADQAGFRVGGHCGSMVTSGGGGGNPVDGKIARKASNGLQ